MRLVSKILIYSCAFFSAHNTFGQNETYLQPFTSPTLINPSFSGYNSNTSFRSGNHYYSLSADRAYNLFYSSYDTYSDGLKGGIGFNFQHGIIGHNNISTTELGISYARLVKKNKKEQFIISAQTGFLLGTKQWYTYFIDRGLKDPDDQPSPPGKKFTRYYRIKPGCAFLWKSQTLLWGASVILPLESSLSHKSDKTFIKSDDFPLNATLYLAKTISSNRKGLKSSPFETYPELIVFYHENFFMSRLSMNVKHIDCSYGLFMQNDYSNNIHCLGGCIGYRKNNMRINFNAGLGIPAISDKVATICEFSLYIVIPTIAYSKVKPWTPKELH